MNFPRISPVSIISENIEAMEKPFNIVDSQGMPADYIPFGSWRREVNEPMAPKKRKKWDY